MDIMGHDINNLNQIALMNTELLQMENNLASDEREQISNVETATRGSVSLIENVRKIQRVT
ncbi:MAG TPA: hypothetical protein VK436_06570 [Methanocella sp.]|nr:hypothetical protein [Methanocella sp.]